MVVSEKLIGPTFKGKFFLDFFTFDDGTDKLSRNYHYTLRNVSEERRSHLLRGRSL
jgi:hypothetical protein